MTEKVATKQTLSTALAIATIAIAMLIGAVFGASEAYAADASADLQAGTDVKVDTLASGKTKTWKSAWGTFVTPLDYDIYGKTCKLKKVYISGNKLIVKGNVCEISAVGDGAVPVKRKPTVNKFVLAKSTKYYKGVNWGDTTRLSKAKFKKQLAKKKPTFIEINLGKNGKVADVTACYGYSTW